MKKYQRNQNYIVSGETFNEIAEAVNWTKENQAKLLGTEAFSKTFQNGEIRIKYLDEETLPTFSAVAIDDLAIIPEDNKFIYETQTFNANKVTSENAEKPFAICVEPANQGKLTKAILSGITPAKVTIQDAAHGFAKPTEDGDGALESCETGTAKILWKAGESGEQWCVLLLGSGTGSGTGDGDYDFKLYTTGGVTEPPVLHMLPGRVILQSQNAGDAVFDADNSESFSAGDAIDFDFSDAEEGQYLVAGWVYIGDPPENENENAAGTAVSCGILIGKYPDMMTRNGIPNGGGFFLFNIGVIDLEYPEEHEEEPEEPEEEEEEEEEVYPTLSVTKQFLHGSFSITDQYFDLPFSPRLIMDIPETSVLWESDNLVAESAVIRNAPTYTGSRNVYEMLEDEGCDLEIGNTYYAYVSDNGSEVELQWSTSRPQTYEEEEAEESNGGEESGEEEETIKIRNRVVAEIVYLEDEPFKINLYQLSAYADIPAARGGYETYMVRINDEDWPPDYLESKIIGDEVEQGDAEKYAETEGFIKHLVVEVEDEEDENNSGEENEEEDDRKNLALKTVWDYKGIPKFYEHETPMTLIAKDGGNNNDPKLEWESYGKIRTEDADKNPGFMKDKFEAGPGVSFSWTGNKLKVSASSVEIDQHAQWLLNHNQQGKIDTTIGGPPSSGKYYLGASNGTLGWQTGDSSGGGGGGTAEYNGMWKVSIDESSNKFCINPFSGGNNIFVNGTLAKIVTSKLEINSTAAANTTKYIYMEYQVASSQCSFHVQTSPTPITLYDNIILLAVWTANTLIQVQYGPIKIVNNTYSGQWAVRIDNGCFSVPASAVGNLILTEDRVLLAVTNELRTSGIDTTETSWCYLHVSLQGSTPYSLAVYTQPIQTVFNYSDYTVDKIPLAVHSPSTGLIQLQYGPVRLNRYWVYDTGAQ